MGHIVLRHYASQFPHTPRLRRRMNRIANAVRPSHAAQLWYRGKLHGIVGELQKAGLAIGHALKPHWPAATTNDAAPPHVADEIRKGRAKFRGIRGVGADIATKVVGKNLDAVDTRLSATVKASIGVDIRVALTREGPIREEMQRATTENVDLITSIPEQYFDKLEDMVTENWESGKRWEDLIDGIEHVGEVTESRAALIARDQTQKLNSAFNRVRQTSIGVEKYEWQTAGDDRVRESHAELDGQIFSWDDPPVVDGEPANPGEPIDCRCVASPSMDLDDVEEAVEEDEDEDQTDDEDTE